MNTCNNRVFVKPFLQGTLSGPEGVQFEEHLQTCSDCREELARLEKDRTTIPYRPIQSSLATPWKQALEAVATSVPQEPRPNLSEWWEGLTKYRVVREVGRGSMGIVCEAYESGLDRKVALKRLLLEDADDERKERLLREARVLARLDHPNIVRVHGLEVHKEVPFLVMEFVEGRTLADVLCGREQPPADAARLVLVLARAVQHAHEAGIYHRDLKPLNILLAPRRPEPEFNTPYGCPKVADFGLARDRRNQLQLTRNGDVAGSPCYMAREQAKGDWENIGPPTDVYALGVILYEMLTGQVPFTGSVYDVMRQVVECEPQSPAERKSGLPAELTAICLRCLAKSPSDRYCTAALLAEALERFLEPPMAPVPPPRPGRRWLGIVGLVMALALGVGAILWAWSVYGGTEPSKPSVDAEEPLRDGSAAVVPWNVDVTLRTATKDKPWTPITAAHALPVHSGDRIRIDVKSNQPAYAYLVLLTSQGDAVPLWPWNQNNIKVKNVDAPLVEQKAALRFSSPVSETLGWRMDKIAGLETVLVMVSREPPPAGLKLSEVLGATPKGRPARLRHLREAVALRFDRADKESSIEMEQERGIEDEAAEVNGPVLQVMSRVRAHFDVVRAVRFAHVGE